MPIYESTGDEQHFTLDTDTAERLGHSKVLPTEYWPDGRIATVWWQPHVRRVWVEIHEPGRGDFAEVIGADQAADLLLGWGWCGGARLLLQAFEGAVASAPGRTRPDIG